MSSKNMNNYYENNEGYDENGEYENNYYNNVNYQNNNNNYYNKNNYKDQYNNYYQNNYYNNNNNYNNPYGNVLHYYNNYPVYASIPASVSYSNNPDSNNQEETTEDNKEPYIKKTSKESANNLIGKTSLKSKKSKGGIVLTYNKQDICHARPPQYAPGFIGMAPGKPAYAMKPPQ